MNKSDPFSEIRTFYDAEYYRDTRYSAGSVPRHARRIAARLGAMAGKRVLDVACGPGDCLAELASRRGSVAGIEISERAIEVCLYRFKGGEFAIGPAEHLPFSDSRYDWVTCLGSLEHFIDKSAALMEMQRVVTAEARFLILVPNAGFLTRRLGLFRGTEQVRVREDALALEVWDRLFRDAGLRVIRRWRDLHPLSLKWINRGPFRQRILRAAEAISLSVWSPRWRYCSSCAYMPRRAGRLVSD